MAHLVRSFQTYARNRSLTTGTFNRIIKDRITIRLSGAYSVQPGTHLVRIRPSSKPFKHTVRSIPSQRMHPTEFPLDFHNGNSRMADRRADPEESKPRIALIQTRSGMGLPPCKCWKAQGILGRARAEDKKLKKELTLEVLALKVPFGSLLSVSESSPVAGAIQGTNPCQNIRCRTRTRVAKSAQPATQLLSVHCL